MSFSFYIYSAANINSFHCMSLSLTVPGCVQMLRDICINNLFITDIERFWKHNIMAAQQERSGYGSQGKILIDYTTKQYLIIFVCFRCT